MTRPSVLLPDAGLLIAHLRKKPEAERWLSAHLPAVLAISTATLFEMECGVHLAHDPELEHRNIARLLGVVTVLPFIAEAACHAAAVRAALERMASPIGPYGTVLAGHAMAVGAGVVSDNLREFKRVKGLHVESWRASTTG